ncbi:MAG: N-acetylmuramoyl-L-alanine amidase, partial [Clostridia bacterium]|nr:N-acetylmuramoyl-L-alanine amidase [Clostridia bacterium]
MTVILDPGHGGADGGAVGVSGVYEKDLNLSVALGVAALLREAGVEVILTRTEDVLLSGEAAKGHRKEEDLKNRLAVAAAHPDA